MADPKIHFDIDALCEAALSSEIGVIISTNNPKGFKRIMYAHMAAKPQHKLHIYSDRASSNRFGLLKQAKETYHASAA